MRLIKYTLLFLITLTMVAQFCFAQDSGAYKKQYNQDSIKVDVALDSTKLSIVEPFDVSVTVAAPKNVETDLSFESNDNFELENLRKTKVATKDSLEKRKYILTLMPKTVGNQTLNGIVLAYSSPDAHELDKKIPLEAIDVRVGGFLSDKDYQQIDSKGIQSYFDKHITIEGNEKLPLSKKLIAVVIALVLLIAIVIVLLLRRANQPEQEIRIIMNARDIASRLLEKLESENLVQDGEYKRYYQDLSNILRYYIEYRFGINAPDKTTEEFFDALRDEDVLDAITKSELKEFLTHCDMVKFAKRIPSLDDMKAARNLATEFVDKTYDSEKDIDITDDVKIRELLGV